MNKLQCGTGVVLLALAVAAGAETLRTGLYTATEGDTGQVVQRADIARGGEVRLDGLLSSKLSDASLVSMSNDNDLYRLSLKAGPIPEGGDRQHLAVVIGGLCLPVWGHSDRQADGLMSVETQVAGKEATQKVAKELGIEPQSRKHPGHKLLVTVQPKQSSYRPDEAVTLVMTIRNVGETTVSFYDGGKQRGSRNNQFSFMAFRQAGVGPALPDTGDPKHFGGPMGIKRLAPGDVFTKEVVLTGWFKFAEPDTYGITAMYELGLLDEGDRTRTLWDDFAVARCFVRVTAPEPAGSSSITAPVKDSSRGENAGT